MTRHHVCYLNKVFSCVLYLVILYLVVLRAGYATKPPSSMLLARLLSSFCIIFNSHLSSKLSEGTIQLSKKVYQLS